MKAILGEKLGMTQVFNDEASAIPVTVIKAGPCRVVQIKSEETDGYNAIQISYREIPPRKVNQPMAGHFNKASVPPARHLVEVRVDDPAEYTLGQEIAVSDVLEKGMKADVAGVSKGKGFAGVMKRHNFAGQGASHGAHRVHRGARRDRRVCYACPRVQGNADGRPDGWRPQDQHEPSKSSRSTWIGVCFWYEAPCPVAKGPWCWCERR